MRGVGLKTAFVGWLAGWLVGGFRFWISGLSSLAQE